MTEEIARPPVSNAHRNRKNHVCRKRTVRERHRYHAALVEAGQAIAAGEIDRAVRVIDAALKPEAA